MASSRTFSNDKEDGVFRVDTRHYDCGVYDRDRYKSAKTVVRMLVDIVSKNGNLLLNIPVRGDGSIDEKEEAILEGIAAWMDIHKECIFGTRPWKIFGEGPALAEVAELRAQRFNEGCSKPLTANDVRFTTKADVLYAFAMGRPTEPPQIKALRTDSKHLGKRIAGITLLGSQEVIQWSQAQDALIIFSPRRPSSVTKPRPSRSTSCHTTMQLSWPRNKVCRERASKEIYDEAIVGPRRLSVLSAVGPCGAFPEGDPHRLE